MKLVCVRKFFVLFALLAACAAPSRDASSDLVHLVVLHTNDVHGQVLTRRDRETGDQVGGLPRLAAEVARVRAEHVGPSKGVLVLDAGDWFQGTPEGGIDRGAAFVSVFTDVGFDAMAVGNHEFDHGLAQLLRILEVAEPPALVANLRDPESGVRVDWASPYAILETAGLRIGVVGLLATETPTITHPDAREIRFVDPVEALGVAVEELEGRVDLVIPLTHVGLEEDLRIASAFDELPLIVGGHSHTRLDEGVREDETLVVQTGSKAMVLGRVDLWIDPATDEVVESRARLVALDAEPADEHRRRDLERACAELVRRSDERMNAVVGELEAPLTRASGPRSSAAGNLIADVFRVRGNADVGLHNKGGIRTNVAAGEVRRRDLYELLPFDNSLVVLELTGAELFECARRGVEDPAHSGIEVSGMRLTVRPGTPRATLLEAEVGGVPLDEDRVYRVATNSFLARGGDGYLDDDPERPTEDTRILLRDALEDEFRRRGSILPPNEDRYRTVE